jgi:hypothetical protein
MSLRPSQFQFCRLAPFACLLFSLRASAAPLYVESKGCRPADEEGEFLQSCVKVATGKKAGKVLGPGWAAPGGQAAAVLQHRRYGAASDRITLRLHGAMGRFEGSYQMGAGSEEFHVVWSPAGRFLAWVEVDGRGGQLRVVDRIRRRVILTTLTPLEEWPFFAPSGSKLLLPVGTKGEERVRELCILDLLVKGSRQTVLRAGADEELVQPRWTSPLAISAVRRKVGTAKGKTVQGAFTPPPPPATQEASDE